MIESRPPAYDPVRMEQFARLIADFFQIPLHEARSQLEAELEAPGSRVAKAWTVASPQTPVPRGPSAAGRGAHRGLDQSPQAPRARGGGARSLNSITDCLIPIDRLRAYCHVKVPFGKVEAINGNIRAMIRRGRGYRDHEYLLLKVQKATAERRATRRAA